MTTAYNAEILEAISLLSQAIISSINGPLPTPLNADREVQAILRAVGRGVMGELLQNQGQRVVERHIEEGLGVHRNKDITVECIFGPVKVASPYLRGHCRNARPVRTELGLRDGSRSEAVERALSDFGAEESFEMASRRFEEHYGWAIGRTSILRTVKRHAERAEVYIRSRLAEVAPDYDIPLAQRPGVKQLLTELDGCEIRTGVLQVCTDEAERTEVRQLPKRKRAEAWRDVRVGLVREIKASEKTYVARMDSYPNVVGQLFQAAVDRGLSARTEVIAVADGGNGLREELGVQMPNLCFILDRPHLKGHLYETAEACGLSDEDRESWVKNHMERIDSGKVSLVLSQLEAHKGRGKKRVLRLIKYIRRFQDAVHYERYREQGFPIGSGEVESAHRYIPQKRLKIPGACWRPESINPMLALRVVRANGWWDDFWKADKIRTAA